MLAKGVLATAPGYVVIHTGHVVPCFCSGDFFKDWSLWTTWDSTGSLPQRSTCLYELILNRHRASSFVITSNRAVEEWLGLFEDPILGNSALDRLANASYQIVIEGSSYRERQSPHRALLEAKGVIDRTTLT